MTEQQWEQYDEIVRRTGLRVEKITERQYYIVDDHARLSESYLTNEAAALALLTQRPTTSSVRTTDACTKPATPGAKPIQRARRQHNSILDAL